MLIAKVDDRKNILAVAPYEKLFDIPMPEDGLDDQWYIDNGCVQCSSYKDYNPETQILVGTEYYVENNVAFNVVVVNLSKQEKKVIEQAKRLIS